MFSNTSIYAKEKKDLVSSKIVSKVSQELDNQEEDLDLDGDDLDSDNMNSEIEIKDITLKNIILEEIKKLEKDMEKKSDKKITKINMMLIKRISYNGLDKEKIKDLSGLEYAVNLEFLDLSNNEISDLSPISNLKNIKRLYMVKNNIEDISSISNCINMTDMSFDENKIEDISYLSKMNNMKYLVLRKNNIKDIQSLSNMKELDTLNLEGNQIKDISPIKDLVNIKNLILYGNQIEDIEALKDLRSLERLEISKNKIENFEAISWFSNNENFGYSNQILNIKPIENKINIELKDIDGSNIDIMSKSVYYDRVDKKYKKLDNIMDFKDGFYSYSDEGIRNTYDKDKRNISNISIKNKNNKTVWNLYIDPSELNFEFAYFIPELKKLEIIQNEKIDIKKCIINAPENSTVKILEDVDTSEVGEKSGIIKVIFSDGSTKNINVLVNVIKKKANYTSSSTGNNHDRPVKVDRKRISGKDRYETSLKSADLVKSDTLVLSSGENFADSLSAQNIVNKFDAKLVLLNNKSNLDEILKETKPSKVYIVGGKNSINKEVEDKILNKVEETKRIAGSDRYETSEKSLKETNYKEVGVADGRDFPDALSSSAISVKKDIGLKLVDGSKEYKSDRKVIYTYGGKKSVIQDGGKRLSGVDRYKTNEEINEELGKSSTVTFVDGRNYPDAISAINVIQASGSNLLLTHPVSNSIKKDFIKDIKRIFILGGKNSVDEEIINDIFK